MKPVALLVLALFCLVMLSPGSMTSPQAAGDAVCIHNLDVCHSKVAGANPDLPCISQCPCKMVPLGIYIADAISTPPFMQFIIAFTDEDPPRI